MKFKDVESENKDQIRTIQLNPKLRLFLLISSSWLIQAIVIFLIVVAFLAIGDTHNYPLTSYLFKHFYIIWILIGFGAMLAFCYVIIYGRVGIKFLPKELHKHYLRKNNDQLKKIKNLEITEVNNLFKVKPICSQTFFKKSSERKKEDQGLTEIEKNTNRLVVNGKLADLDFSWGVVTQAKKPSFKVLFLCILYLGPVIGFLVGLLSRLLFNVDLYQSKEGEAKVVNWNKVSPYSKLGCWDLLPSKIGKKNSENYLIFAAKLKVNYDLITLIPQTETQESSSLKSQYLWPTNLSHSQTLAIQNLMKTMKFLPSIYLDHDNLSIVMKKYHYNVQDNQELQTWELLKTPDANSEIQFNYLQQAIKIYQIFNQQEEQNESES